MLFYYGFMLLIYFISNTLVVHVLITLTLDDLLIMLTLSLSAPRVTETPEGSHLVEWCSVKCPGEDSIMYRLQMLQAGKDQDYSVVSVLCCQLSLPVLSYLILFLFPSVPCFFPSKVVDVLWWYPFSAPSILFPSIFSFYYLACSLSCLLDFVFSCHMDLMASKI